MNVLPQNNLKTFKPANSLGQLMLAVDGNADRAILFKWRDSPMHGVDKSRGFLLWEKQDSYHWQPESSTVMYHLMMKINSEKGNIRQFYHCVNIIGYTYTNLDAIAHYTPGLNDTAYCSEATNQYSMLLYYKQL